MGEKELVLGTYTGDDEGVTIREAVDDLLVCGSCSEGRGEREGRRLAERVPVPLGEKVNCLTEIVARAVEVATRVSTVLAEIEGDAVWVKVVVVEREGEAFWVEVVVVAAHAVAVTLSRVI